MYSRFFWWGSEVYFILFFSLQTQTYYIIPPSILNSQVYLTYTYPCKKKIFHFFGKKFIIGVPCRDRDYCGAQELHNALQVLYKTTFLRLWFWRQKWNNGENLWCS